MLEWITLLEAFLLTAGALDQMKSIMCLGAKLGSRASLEDRMLIDPSEEDETVSAVVISL